MKIDLDELFLKTVCIDPDPISLEELKQLYSTLQAVYDETVNYIRSLMGSEQYVFEMRLPIRSISVLSVSGNSESNLEMLHIPFITCSMELWEKLLADKDNPVFELAGFMHKCVDFIRSVTDIAEYDSYTPLTTEVLDKCNILDVFSTHSYEYIYDDIERYIG